MKFVCKICGLTEDAHSLGIHVPIIVEVPGDCVCFEKWTEEIQPVCDEYVRWRKNDDRCENCEHDERCHR